MKVLKILPKKLNEIIKILAKAVKDGEVLILPTDTVYGLVANAKNEKAVKNLFKIKRRKFIKTLPIFIKNIKMAKEFAYIDEKQEKFFKKAWPGKMTSVLKAKPLAKKLFKIGIINSERKIGLRIPKYKLINLLLNKLNFPITGTSANISGKPASTKIKKILKQFENRKKKPDLIVDVGNLPKNKPSAVLDLTISPPKILRK